MSHARSVEPVTAFAAIARALTASLELPEVLRRIASETRGLTRATGVSILLQRGEIVEFVAHDSEPPGSQIPVGFQFRAAPAMVAALALRREPFVILDLHSSPLIPREVKEQIFARDLIMVPLRVDDQLIGVLNIAFHHLPEDWVWDPALLQALGDQAAVAVRNAQLYEAARRSSEQLLQAEKLSALGRLVARVAHELNNPLTTARLLAESLDLEPLPFGAMEQVQALGRELEHAAAVVGDLLLLASKDPAEFAPVPLHPLVRSTVEELERRLSASGVRVAIEIPATLPPVRADRHRLRQVLANLLQNAAQALAGAPGERRVLVRAREGGAEERRVVLEVEDNGPGIPPRVMARLFEPFFTTKPMGEGTGLGLAIVREIVEAHGGTIEAANAPAGGAIFRLALPVAESAMAEAAPPAAPEAAAPRGLRVLVIDDEPELQRALRRVLEHLGCDVTSALSGEDGLRRAGLEAFDLILCDVRIPGVSGRQIYERLSAEASRAVGALAFMTGDSLTPEIRDFLASTGRPSLAKPFGRAQLQEILGLVKSQGPSC